MASTAKPMTTQSGASAANAKVTRMAPRVPAVRASARFSVSDAVGWVTEKGLSGSPVELPVLEHPGKPRDPDDAGVAELTGPQPQDL